MLHQDIYASQDAGGIKKHTKRIEPATCNPWHPRMRWVLKKAVYRIQHPTENIIESKAGANKPAIRASTEAAGLELFRLFMFSPVLLDLFSQR